MNQQISSFFIRPPRQTYFEHDLGPQIFTLKSEQEPKARMAQRTNFIVSNNRNFKINASFYNIQSQITNKCLIYLHTHHGSRLQATFIVQPLLALGVNVCLFDFCGYGNSEGDTVTLGVREADDIRVVIQELQRSFNQQDFILWGRSMGAVASILYLYHQINNINKDSNQKDLKSPNIIAAIFDSPFYSLSQLTLQLCSKSLGLPQTLLIPFIYLIKKSLQSKLNFQQLQLQQLVLQIKIPCIFITSKQDKFVSHVHSERLYQKYGGPKQLIYIEKDHNQPRKEEDLGQVFGFIGRRLAVNKFMGIGKFRSQKKFDMRAGYSCDYGSNSFNQLYNMSKNQDNTSQCDYKPNSSRQNFSELGIMSKHLKYIQQYQNTNEPICRIDTCRQRRTPNSERKSIVTKKISQQFQLNFQDTQNSDRNTPKASKKNKNQQKYQPPQPLTSRVQPHQPYPEFLRKKSSLSTATQLNTNKPKQKIKPSVTLSSASRINVTPTLLQTQR